jgi:hypothetical protein
MGGDGLLGDQRVGFGLVLAPLGVAENDVAHGEFLEHAGGDLAGVSAEVVFAHVLRAQADVESRIALETSPSAVKAGRPRCRPP